MASRGNWFVSRSVALSLAALLVLSGAMFVVTTLQQDSEEWVLVEDHVLDDGGVASGASLTSFDGSSPNYVFSFDEETSVYTYDLTDGTKGIESSRALFAFCPVDGFDYSKDYKFVVTSESQFGDFSLYSISDSSFTSETKFNLRTVESDDDGLYSASIILYDQYVTDLSYKTGFYVACQESATSSTFEANTFTLQVYELQNDNTGSIAAGVTGLLLIVMGVFAMPMHNILRRK